MKSFGKVLKSFLYMFTDPATVILMILPAIAIVMNVYATPSVMKIFRTELESFGSGTISLSHNITAYLLNGAIRESQWNIGGVVLYVVNAVMSVVRGSWIGFVIACSIVGGYLATFAREYGYEQMYLSRPISRLKLVSAKLLIIVLSSIAIGLAFVVGIYGIVGDSELYAYIVKCIALPLFVKTFLLTVALQLLSFSIAYIVRRSMLAMVLSCIVLAIFVPMLYNKIYLRLQFYIPSLSREFIDVEALSIDYTVILFVLSCIVTSATLYLRREVV